MSTDAGARIAIDQRIARSAARLLAHTPATPNLVTASSILVGLSAAWLLAQGQWRVHLGAGLFVVAVWMDHLDGELARQTGRTSTFGHYFDHAAALTNYIAAFVGAGIGLRHGWLGGWAILAGVAAGLAIAAIMSTRLVVEVVAGRDAVRQTVHGGFEIEDTLYVLAPVAWMGLLDHFVVLAAFGAPLFLLYVLWSAFRSRRTQQSLDDRP